MPISTRWMCFKRLLGDILVPFLVQTGITWVMAITYLGVIRAGSGYLLKYLVSIESNPILDGQKRNRLPMAELDEKLLYGNMSNEEKEKVHKVDITWKTSTALFCGILFNFLFPVFVSIILKDYLLSKFCLFFSYSIQISYFFDMHIWPVGFRMGEDIALTMIQPIVVMSMYCVSYIIG